MFFYGLFMDEALLRSKGVEPEHMQQASVQGFQLRIAQRATLVPMPGSTVHGMVASLKHSELEQLYSEPTVRDYRPEPVVAHLRGGGQIPALCFNLIATPSAGEHNREYAERLRTLAQRLGLPSEYVASIQSDR